MSDEELVGEETSELRRRAEEIWSARVRRARQPPTEAEALRLIHELEVHQIELEMQFEELRAANARLSAERERYRELFDFAPTGYVTLARDGTMSQLNLAGASLLGADVEQLVGKRLATFLAEADRGKVDELLREVLDGGMPSTRDLLLQAGSDRSLHVEAIPSVSGSECRASFWETTAIRRAERAVRLRDRAMHSVSQGILILDATTSRHPIVYANPSLEETTGYTAQEIDGRSWHFLVGEKTDRDAIAEIDAAFDAGRVCSIELLCYRKNGSTYWSVLHVTPVHDEQGHVTELVIVQVDVSERRALEEALGQAQRMEAIGRLSGGIAHDFNNLLMVIASSATLASESLDDLQPSEAVACVRESLEAITDAGARAAALTRQLLGLTRRHVARPVVVSLNDSIEATMALLRRLIPADVELRTVLDPTPCHLKIDPAHLEQVLLNLVVNARDALPRDGTIVVESRTTVLSPAYCKPRDGLVPGPFARISVTDDGGGMDAATKARIFEPFFTTEDGRGTGLGLATAYWVVKRNGGELTVESEVGRGSTFVVFLPLTDERPKASEPPPPLPTPMRTERVLLAEDQPQVRATVARVLEQLGYEVLAASDGVAALALLEAHPGGLHALVTDVVMPRMGGRDLADRVRALHPGARVLFMSGYTDDPSLLAGFAEGEASFLQKPFSPDALDRALRRLLASSRAAHASK